MFCFLSLNRNQIVSLYGYKSNLGDVKYGPPQGSILRQLLFLVYVNDFQLAIKYFKEYHFADDNNLFIFNSWVKSFNKQAFWDKLIKGKQNLPFCR